MTSRTEAAAARWRRLALAGLLGAAVAAAGCGVYSVRSGRLDPTLKRVAVPFLENLSAEPNIEIELTDAIIRALQDDNTLKVSDEEHADTILQGKVLRYKLQEAFARADLRVDEYQVQILVELSLGRRGGGEPVFEKRRITGTGNFILNDPEGTSEATARAKAAAEIVREVIALVVEDW